MQLPFEGLTSAGRRTAAASRRPGSASAGSTAGPRDAEKRPKPAAQSQARSSYFRYGGPEDWRVDERTRAAGRRGLADARAALARLRASEEGRSSAENAA